MDIIDQFIQLTEAGKFQEALPLIEELVNRAPHISTSWFNYGICLSESNRLPEAADAFLKAYELDDQNGGALYQACLALAKGNEAERLVKIFERECERDVAMIQLFLDEEAFNEFFTQKRFKALKAKYNDHR